MGRKGTFSRGLRIGDSTGGQVGNGTDIISHVSCHLALCLSAAVPGPAPAALAAPVVLRTSFDPSGFIAVGPVADAMFPNRPQEHLPQEWRWISRKSLVSEARDGLLMEQPVTAAYDANIRYPAPLRDLFIRLARAGLVRARWTEQINDGRRRDVPGRRRQGPFSLFAWFLAGSPGLWEALPDRIHGGDRRHKEVRTGRLRPWNGSGMTVAASGCSTTTVT